MSMATPDWALYVEAWHDDTPGHTDIERLARALRVRRLVTVLVVSGEAALTIGLAVFTWAWARNPEVLTGAWALVGIWAVWLVATAFAWWNRRGQWVVDVANLEEFAELSLERAVRKIRVVWFSLALTVVQLALLYAIGDRGSPLPEFWIAATATCIAVGGWASWYYRGAVAERTHFGRILRERAFRNHAHGDSV